MKLKEIQRDRRKKVVLSIRTTEEISEWMRKHDVSPTMVFHKTIEEFMEKDGKNKVQKS